MVGVEWLKPHVSNTNSGYFGDGIVGYRLESEPQVDESNWGRLGFDRNLNNLGNNKMNNLVVVVDDEVVGAGCNGDMNSKLV